MKPSEVEENIEPIPYSEYGPYCPICLVNEGWLQLGKEEFELQVRGLRYRFYSEKDMEDFKLNVEYYVEKEVKKGLKVPNPRILMMGIKGSGLKTQMSLLYKKYKIPKIDFKDEFLKILEREKTKRKKNRELMRGFKPKESILLRKI